MCYRDRVCVGWFSEAELAKPGLVERPYASVWLVYWKELQRYQHPAERGDVELAEAILFDCFVVVFAEICVEIKLQRRHVTTDGCVLGAAGVSRENIFPKLL